ncbi:hypothetical protein [Alicyclobacillus mengziensis]|uniref:Uncharacterized protein n=1 Tax=Alicyclobacillus mengziensis TaxID=2931921 RepID=A0A9X7VW42_9BACL|nr:hypothetical protein [Alicyclobacillus mengziensis]QSO46161.1 hypothetical protein JZ786_16805 [Alicyclobacillus mengziensis]
MDNPIEICLKLSRNPPDSETTKGVLLTFSPLPHLMVFVGSLLDLRA